MLSPMALTLSNTITTLLTTKAMPSDLVQRIDTSLLYPPFFDKVALVLSTARAMGQDYVVISGYRSHKEQAAIYAQGRTKPGKRVTNARAGFSAHNWGIAVDVVADVSQKRGLQPSWAPEVYLTLHKAALQHGVQAGVPGLDDYGHLQFPLTQVLQRKEVEIFKTLNDVYASGGMPAAWRQLDVWGFAAETPKAVVSSALPPPTGAKG